MITINTSSLDTDKQDPHKYPPPTTTTNTASFPQTTAQWNRLPWNAFIPNNLDMHLQGCIAGYWPENCTLQVPPIDNTIPPPHPPPQSTPHAPSPPPTDLYFFSSIPSQIPKHKTPLPHFLITWNWTSTTDQPNYSARCPSRGFARYIINQPSTTAVYPRSLS